MAVMIFVLITCMVMSTLGQEYSTATYNEDHTITLDTTAGTGGVIESATRQ